MQLGFLILWWRCFPLSPLEIDAVPLSFWVVPFSLLLHVGGGAPSSFLLWLVQDVSLAWTKSLT